MAQEKVIKISINPKGDVSFEVNGVKGTSCLAETQFLEDALGGKVLAQEPTSEYSEEGVTTDETVRNES